MSFKVISNTHIKDRDLPDPNRSFDLSLRLSLLNGTFYNNLPHEFHEVRNGDGSYIFMIDRKPNVPSGTNEIRTQMSRHAATLFGDFPQIETADKNARDVLNDWVKEAEVEERLRHAAYIGSTGSVAVHIKALPQKNGMARVFVDVYATEFLTPEFDENQPDVLTKITEKYKIKGSDVRAMGYIIDDDDINSWFWFLRIWDGKAENWFVPWKLDTEKKLESQGKTFIPTRDDGKSVDHALGFCPWVWTKTPGGDTDAIDGPCTFDAGIEHAIQLDYQDSQIVAGVKYAMSPQTIFKIPSPDKAGIPPTGDASGGIVHAPDTILTIQGDNADVFYLEMDGAGFEQGRAKSKELRTNLIEFVNGDRVDPKEITNGHQGSKTLAQLNAPMLNYVKVLQKVYGDGTLKRVLFMFMKIATKKRVMVNEERVKVSAGKLKDLTLRWAEFYELTSAEKLSDAQAADTSIKNGTLSRETAINDLAKTYAIQDIAVEQAKIAADQQNDIKQATLLAAAQVQVMDKTTIS